MGVPKDDPLRAGVLLFLKMLSPPGLAFVVTPLLSVFLAHPACSELHFVPLRSFTGPPPFSIGFGQTVAALGDVDGDGVRDFAVGAPSGADYVYIPDLGGQVVVYSGQSSRELYRLAHGGVYEYFGSSLAGGSDVDGDGVMDLVVGAPGAVTQAGTGPTGSVFLYSAATGALLRRWDGSQGAGLGSTVTFVGDLDGDGVRDIAVAAGNLSVVSIYSSTSGALIHEIPPPLASDTFGYSIADLGDVTGDGVSDIAIGAPGECYGYLTKGVWIVDGALGQILRHLPPPGICGGFGESLASIEDLDGDGRRDLAIASSELRAADTLFIYSTALSPSPGGNLLRVVPVDAREGNRVDGGRWRIASVTGVDGTPGTYVAIGSPDAYSGDGHAGALALYSIAADSITHAILGVDGWEELGRAVSSFGDVNGDGRPDLLVTAPGTRVGRQDVLPGGVAVYGFAEVEPSEVTFATGDGRVNLASAVPLEVYVEGAPGRYSPGDVEPETVRLRLAANAFRSIQSISAAPFAPVDFDGDGTLEFQARFSKSDLRELLRFESTPVDTMSVVIEGDLSDGRRLQAPLLLRIGTPPVVVASVIPNPVTRSAQLTFRTSRFGQVWLRVFDLQGRLVTTALGGEWLPLGLHYVSLGQGGAAALSSGVYFYRLETPDGKSSSRFVVAK